MAAELLACLLRKPLKFTPSSGAFLPTIRHNMQAPPRRSSKHKLITLNGQHRSVRSPARLSVTHLSIAGHVRATLGCAIVSSSSSRAGRACTPTVQVTLLSFPLQMDRRVNMPHLRDIPGIREHLPGPLPPVAPSVAPSPTPPRRSPLMILPRPPLPPSPPLIPGTLRHALAQYHARQSPPPLPPAARAPTSPLVLPRIAHRPPLPSHHPQYPPPLAPSAYGPRTPAPLPPTPSRFFNRALPVGLAPLRVLRLSA